MKKRRTTKTTAQLITAAIEKSNITQAEVAAWLGCGTSTVSAWCAGHQKPNSENLFWLAKMLRTEPLKLLGR